MTYSERIYSSVLSQINQLIKLTFVLCTERTAYLLPPNSTKHGRGNELEGHTQTH